MPRERRHSRKSFPPVMDPDCAICHFPADADCGCEAKVLDTAIKQAEQRIMHAMYMEIRTWVRKHAQDYVLAYFHQLSDQRKAAHQQQVESISAYVYRHYGAPPHPTHTAAADAQFKQGIDEDWQRCIQRYPEVFEYFFSLVEVTIPTENDPSVKDLPTTTMLPIPRKVNRRSRSRPPAAITNGSTHNGSQEGPPRITRGRTPPAIEARRTPGPPPESRHFRVPPPPGSAYKIHYPQYPG